MDVTEVRTCGLCGAAITLSEDDRWVCPTHGERITVRMAQGVIVPPTKSAFNAARRAHRWVREQGDDWWTRPMPESVAADLAIAADFLADHA